MTRAHSHNGANVRGSKARKPTTSRSRSTHPLSADWLKDFLSEMLAVEKGGIKLYEKALGELEHDEFEDKLNEFLDQTHRHVELCSQMLEMACGDSEYISPGAEAADHKAEGLLSTEVPPHLVELNNMENLVLAETKDHWNWEMLGSVVRLIPDEELKHAAMKAVNEVRKQEVSHVKWNEQILSKLAKELATSPVDEESEEVESADASAEDR